MHSVQNLNLNMLYGKLDDAYYETLYKSFISGQLQDLVVDSVTLSVNTGSGYLDVDNQYILNNIFALLDQIGALKKARLRLIVNEDRSSPSMPIVYIQNLLMKYFKTNPIFIDIHNLYTTVITNSCYNSIIEKATNNKIYLVDYAGITKLDKLKSLLYNVNIQNIIYVENNPLPIDIGMYLMTQGIKKINVINEIDINASIMQNGLQNGNLKFLQSIIKYVVDNNLDYFTTLAKPGFLYKYIGRRTDEQIILSLLSYQDGKNDIYNQCFFKKPLKNLLGYENAILSDKIYNTDIKIQIL